MFAASLHGLLLSDSGDVVSGIARWEALFVELQGKAGRLPENLWDREVVETTPRGTSSRGRRP
jgi:hypothetical protein